MANKPKKAVPAKAVKTTKTRVVKFNHPPKAFDASVFVAAGAAAARAEITFNAALLAFAKKDEKAAGVAFKSGYVSERLYGNTSPDNLKKAETIVTPRVKGDEKRTKEENAALKTASKRWDRFRKRHEIMSTDNRGGNRVAAKTAKRKPGTGPKTIKIGPKTTPAEALVAAQAIRQNFTLLLGIKTVKELPAEALSIASEVIERLNRFEGFITEAKKANK